MNWRLTIFMIVAGATCGSTKECDICDFCSEYNPFHGCYEGFAARMQETLSADCAASRTRGLLEEWIKNLQVICSAKTGEIIEPECVCPDMCDLGSCENPFHECFQGLARHMQDTLKADCANYSQASLEAFFRNLQIICEAKLTSPVPLDFCDVGRCTVYSVTGADSGVNAPLVNGVYTLVIGSTCPGPSGEPLPIYQTQTGNQWTLSYRDPFGVYSYHVGRRGWTFGPTACSANSGARLLTDGLTPDTPPQDWTQWLGSAYGFDNPGESNLTVTCTQRGF